MRYTIVFYIKSFLPCGVSPATRSLTGQFSPPPFILFFYLRNDESLIFYSKNFKNAVTKTSLLLEVGPHKQWKIYFDDQNIIMI